MTPEQAIKEAQSGQLLPVYLVVGEERHLSDQVISALRKRVTEGGIVGLNDDTLDAASTSVGQLLAVARTMPMMAAQRWVHARDIEAWDQPAKNTDAKGASTSPFDALTAYAESADPSTILVLSARKLDKRRKLYTTAKKNGWLISCETPKRHEVPALVEKRALSMGHPISRSVASALSELAGPELATVFDALERVCLYVGPGEPVTEEAVSACVVRLRTASVFELVGAVGRRDKGEALRLLSEVYDPADRGLPLIGILAWATRQLIKFDHATRAGLSPPDAAKAAGAPPFKAQELAGQLRGMPPGALSLWLSELSRADLDLKGGSQRTPQATLEMMILNLCRSAA